MAVSASENAGELYLSTPWTLFFRFFAWSVVATLFVFLFNTYLTFWLGWPGSATALGPDASALAWLQILLYLLGIAGPAAFVVRSKSRSLRQDDATMTAIASYIVKAAFWAVLLIGIVDAVISDQHCGLCDRHPGKRRPAAANQRSEFESHEEDL